MEMTKGVAKKLFEVHQASRGYRVLQAGVLLDQAIALMKAGFITRDGAGIFIVGDHEKWEAYQKYGINFKTV